MKRILLLFFMFVLAMTAMAQRTQKITYQAVVRDAGNRLVVYTPVRVDVTITSSTGSYFESLRDTTNANGLMYVLIGGNPGFENIDWVEAVIKTVITIDGGETVTDEVTVTAVPFALQANYAMNVSPTAPTIVAVYNQLQADSLALANRIAAERAHLDDTLSHYLMQEVQVLSISNDTIYLTGGSFVKLPAGFSGDYNDLVNKPTNVSAFNNDAGYITNTDIPTNVSVFTNDAGYLTQEVQVLSVSNDTLYLTGGSWVKLPQGFSGDYNDLANKPDLNQYTTNAHLNDTLSHYYTNTKINDTLAHYLRADDLCDSIVKCDIFQSMRDSIQINATNIANNTTSITNNTTNITNNTTNINNITNNIASLQVVDSTLEARIVADSTNLANNYYNKDEINDTLSHYLMEEVQVLSISNDTIYLTGGSFVKLPAGFSGDYNDLVNRPTNVSAFNNDAGYLTSFTEVQTLSISNDTIYLTGGSFVKLPAGFSGDYNELINKPNLDQYVTNTHLNDTLGHYYTNTEINDTLAHYLRAGDLCDSIVKCGVIQDMRDSIQINATNITHVQTDINSITGNIISLLNVDSILAAQIISDSVLFYKTDSILLARILNDSTNLANNYYNKDEINDTLSHYLMEEVQVLSISNDTIYLTGGSFVKLPAGFSGDYNDLVNRPTNVSAFNNDAGYLTSFTEVQTLSISNDTIYLTGGSFVKLPAGFSGDYNELINKPNLDQYVTNIHLNDTLGHYYVNTEINDTLAHYLQAGDLCDSIVKCGVIQDMRDSIQTNATNITHVQTDINNITGNIISLLNVDSILAAQIISDSVLFYKTDSILMARILSDSTNLANNYYNKDEINDTLSHYLMQEVQVLSISNDTIYLTGGSFVKLPAGFSGDYNDLTNAPTNVSAFNNDAGYLTSFTEVQALSISNDTIYLTGGSFVKLPAGFSGDYNELINKPNLDQYATNIHLNDTLGHYYVNTEINDTLAHYLQAGDLCDSIVKCGVIQDMRDSIQINATNITHVQTDINNITGNIISLLNVDSILAAQIISDSVLFYKTDSILLVRILNDSTNLANNYYNKDEINDTLSHYLMEEVQVLSISNDTIYLTGGSFVKLPAGFSGDYNDLTNAPTKSDLCDSVKPCVTGWISDSTRMVFDTLHNRYTTLTTLNDSLSRYTTLKTLNDTLNHYLRVSDLCDSIVKCGAIQNMHDSIQINTTNISNNTTNITNITNNITTITTDLHAVDSILNARITTDSTALANRIHTDSTVLATRMDTLLKHVCDSVKPCVTGWISDSTRMVFDTLHNRYTTLTTLSDSLSRYATLKTLNDTLSHYLMQEVQVLSVSNDTLYLTGGSWVKLPQGFSGDYNDLTNAPTNVSAFNNDAGYLTSDSAVIVNLNTNVANLQGDVTNLQNADNVLSSRITADSAVLANRIVADSTVLATRMDTLLKHVCDSVQECVTGWISDSTRMVFDTLHGRYTTLKTLNDTLSRYTTTNKIDTLISKYGYLTSDSTVIVMMRDSIQKVNAHVSADSLILAQRIYTDSVVVMDTLHKYYATKDTLKNFVKKDALCTEVMACDDIQTMRDSIQKVNAHVSADSLILAQRIHTDSVVVMDTLHKYYATKDTLKNFVKKDALCTEVMACDDIQTMRDSIQKVNAHVSADSLILAQRIHTDSVVVMDTLHKYYATKDTLKNYYTRYQVDTAKANIRNEIQNGTLTITYGSTVTTFTANQATGDNVSVTIPTPEEQVQADWKETDALKTSYIRNKPNIRDSVNRVVLDSLYAANSAMNKAIDTIARNNIRDSLAVVREKIYTDSTVLATRIHKDSLTMASRMDTLLKHVCDSVKPCVTGWMNDTLKAYTTTNKIDTLIQKYGYATNAHLNDTLGKYTTTNQIDTLIRKYGYLTSDSAVIVMMRDSIQKVNAHVSADSLVLANRIVADSTALAHRMDTLLKHVCDSVQECVTGWISDSTRMVFDTLHGRYTTLKTLNDTLSRYTTTNQIDTLIQKYGFATNAHLNDTLGKYTTTDKIDTLIRKYGYLTSDSAVIVMMRDSIQKVNAHVSADSLILANRIHTDSAALANLIHTDSTALAHRMDTLLKHVCDSVKPCVTGWISDSTRMVFDTLHGRYTTLKTLNDTLNHYTTTDKIDTLIRKYGYLTSDSAVIVMMRDSIQKVNKHVSADSLILANRIHNDSLALVNRIVTDSTALAHRMDTILKHVCDSVKPCVTGWISDTASAIRNSLGDTINHYIGKADLVIMQGTNTLGTFNANQTGTTVTVVIPTPEDQVKSDWEATTGAAEILHKPNIRDSVNRVVLDSLYAENSAMNKAIDTIARNNIHDSLIVVREKIHTDSTILAHRMDTLLKHVCDSVKPCVTGWISDSTRMVFDTLHRYYTSLSTLADSMHKVDVRIKHDSLEVVALYEQAQNALTALALKDKIDSTALVTRIVADSTALSHRMDTLLKHVCDSVKPCVTSWISDSTRMVFDTLHKYYTNLSTLADSMHKVDVRIKHDSLEVVALYEQAQNALTALALKDKIDSTALANRISTDSTILAHRMDTLLKHVCDSVKPCVTSWISDSTRMVFDTLHSRYTTLKTLKDSTTAIRGALVDTARNIRNSIGNATLTIKQGETELGTFKANQNTDKEIIIPAQVNADWDATEGTAQILNKPEIPTVNDATLTIQKNGTTVGTFTANQADNNTINITVPTCDSLAECDLIKSILARLDKLERQNDSLARELEKMKPNLTVSANESVTVCSGSTLPVTYTATFHNCSSSDYTLAWKVNGTDSSAVTGAVLTLNVEEEGSYKVVCIATRSDNTFVTDTVTTAITVDNAIPSFTTNVTDLTVSLTDVANTATIQWDTDSAIVEYSDATHTFSVADTITITAISERGCTFSKGLRLEPIDPTVTTDSVPNATIAATTAKAYGTVTSDGGVPATKRGMVYSTSNQNLKFGASGVDSVIASGTGKGSYSCDLTKLVPCTQYYVRAFAFNDEDTVYGEVKQFSTHSFTCGSTLTDIDGNEYATLLLGSQCWMQQNLRTTRYADGVAIILDENTGTDSPRRYAPGSEADNVLNAYGYLYNWAAAARSTSSSTNPSGVQGVCPDGWHLPSDAEWTQLTNFVSSDPANVCGNDPTYIIKSMVSQERWGDFCDPNITSPVCQVCDNLSTNNRTGFSVLPSGTWENGATAHGYTNNGHTIFCTATAYETISAWVREFYPEHTFVERTAVDRQSAFSVRCVLDCSEGYTYKPTVSAVTLSSTATISMTANVISDGGANVTERGVCWSTSQHPTTSSDHTADSGTGTGEFTVSGSLTPGTTYYVRAYATNSEGTAYGAEVTYITPMPTTTPTVNTGSQFLALTEGFEASLPSWSIIDNDGDGKKWSISFDPHSGSRCALSFSFDYENNTALTPDNYLITPDITLPSGISSVLTFWYKGSGEPGYSDEHFSVKIGSAGASTVGDFSTELFSAESSVEYDSATVNLNSYAGQTIRLAFVHNDTDKGYLCIDDIVVGVAGAGDNIVGDVTATTATCGGYVSDDGGATVTARGVCWSTSQNPTIGGSGCYNTTDGTGTGSFTSNITGLSANTTYYVRAYAINSEGPAYGNQVSFKTLNRSLDITSDKPATFKKCGASSHTVTYTATPSYGDAGDYTYSWSCSGGTISGTPTSNTATITYTSAASYTVTCTATHNTESFDVSKTASTTIQNSGTPVYLGLCDNGLTITSHEEENNKNSKFAFASSISWGDGSSTTITSAQFSHTYASSGIYTVTVTSTDGCDVTRAFAMGDAVLKPCIVASAHTNTSTFTSSTGGLETTNSDGKVTTVADNDGNTYKVAQIGSQCWMAENLRTTKNPDGTTIAQGSSSTSSDASVAYRYDPVGGVSADPYGYFYNWTSVMNGASASSTNPSGVRGICPLGWHVPSSAEWDAMLNEVKAGTNNYSAKLATGCDWQLQYSTSASSYKWNPGDFANPERNSYGFGALPAGVYLSDANYSFSAYFWTSEASSSSANYYRFGQNTTNVSLSSGSKNNGYSLRCVRD